MRGLRPYELASFEPFRKQTQPVTTPPQIFTLSPARPLNTKSCPEKGSSASCVWTRADNPSNQRRAIPACLPPAQSSRRQCYDQILEHRPIHAALYAQSLSASKLNLDPHSWRLNSGLGRCDMFDRKQRWCRHLHRKQWRRYTSQTTPLGVW